MSKRRGDDVRRNSHRDSDNCGRMVAVASYNLLQCSWPQREKPGFMGSARDNFRLDCCSVLGYGFHRTKVLVGSRTCLKGGDARAP